MDSDLFTVDPQGHLHFTDDGKKLLGPHFAQVGIPLSSITSQSHYDDAMRRARPFHNDLLVRIARNGPLNDERRALLAIAEGHYDTAEILREKLQRKRRFVVHQGGRQ